MKKKNKAGMRRNALSYALVLGGCLGQFSLPAAESAAAKDTPDAKPEAEAEKPSYSNWLELGTGGILIDGAKPAFRQRLQFRDGPFGGLEDFHWEKQIDKKTVFLSDARAMFDTHDYRMRLELSRQDLGFIRGGYKESRSWYNGTGGFFPQGQLWYSLWDQSLFLDRGEAWVEGGLTLKGWPALTFKYTHQFREGKKDSTSWGQADIVPFSPLIRQGISPAFWDLDEQRDIFQGDIRHTFGKTDVDLGLRYELSKNNNALKTIALPSDTPRYLTRREEMKTDLFSVHGSSITRFNERAMFSTGYMFSTMDTDVGGSQIYGNDFDVGYNPALAIGPGFFGLSGGSELKEHLASLNFMWQPWKNWSIVPSMRLQNQAIDSATFYTSTRNTLAADSADSVTSGRNLLEVSERLEVRYTGLSNWVYYARGDWAQGQGDLNERGGSPGGGGFSGLVDRYTKDERFLQRYTVGANWYPSTKVNTDVQFYHKQRENSYDHQVDNTTNPLLGNLYPGYIRNNEFKTDDANVRLTWRARRNLTLVSRYDFQMSEVDTAQGSLASQQTANVYTHILSQNVTWMPWSRLYLQSGLNYVMNETDTPGDDVANTITPSRNDYFNLSASAGFVLDNKTDLNAHYYYYTADNFIANPNSVSYGAEGQEHNVTLALVHRLRENVRLTLKYGFFTFDDKAYQGLRSYDAHLVYGSVQYRF